MRNASNQDELYVAVVIKRPSAPGNPPPDAPGMAQFLADSLSRTGPGLQRMPFVPGSRTKTPLDLNRLYLGLGALCLMAAGYLLCLVVTGLK